MAASGVKDSINEIENICECSICCNTYDEDNHVPRILPCTHTFCTDCLSKHCSRQKIACPLCNKVHKISNKNILIFPKDNTRRELKSVLEKLSKVLCGVCGQHDKNSYFCLSCDIRICPRCYGERKVTTCRNHRLDRKNDSQSASNELSKKDLSRIVCLLNGHERNEMKFYCTERNCCKTVCANCIVEFHSEHIHLVKPVKHEYEARKNHLRDKCNRTKKKIDAAKHTLTELDRETLAMTSNFDRGKVKLDMATRKGIQYMEQYKELENMRWSKKLRDNLSNLTKCRECLQNFIDNATECCTISERSMASKNISEFLSTEKKLSQNFDCFTEMTVDQDIKKLTPSQAFQMRETIKEIEIKSKGLTVPLGAFLRLQAHIFDDEQSIRPFYKGVGIAVIVALLAFLLVQSVAYPHSMDEHRDDSFMEFSNSTDFICQSLDLKVASNVPLDDLSQTCGKGRPFYVYNGAFSNRYLTIFKNDSIAFIIDVRKIETSSTLFEFGLSRGSVSRRDLLGPPSREYIGWVLKRCDHSRQYSLINTNGHILKSKMNIISNRCFKFKVELSRNRSVVLRLFDDRENKLKYIDDQRLPFRSYKGLFFLKLANSNEANITARVISKNLCFDRSTLYHGMFISKNNKEISNNPSAASTEKHVAKNSVYQDIVLRNCSQKCIYVLEFKFKESKPGSMLSLYLMNSRSISLNHVHDLFVFSYGTSLNNLTLPNKGYYELNHVREWYPLIIVIDKKLKSISFYYSPFMSSTQNKHLIGRNDPVLRWVFRDPSAECIIKAGLHDYR